MTPKRISAADPTPLRVVIVTLDSHLAGAVERAGARLAAELPGLTLSLHAAAEWGADPEALERAKRDIASGDIVLACMLFIDDQIRAILPALEARRESCDAMIGCLSAGEVVKQTRLGAFRMDGSQSGVVGLLKRLRGAKGAKPGQGAPASAGARQMAMLRRLPKILRYIPGTAQDVRAYFLTLQYWLSGSDENVVNLVRFLVGRYADGPRRGLRAAVSAQAPVEYPETGLYHPAAPSRVAERLDALPRPSAPRRGRVGLLLMRSYVLANDTRHYDGVIAALEARGLEVVPAFAAGLDARPAIDAFFREGGRPEGRATIDALVSLTGFSLVGGPAYNDAAAAEEALASLDVPYVAAHALEFQTLDQWRLGARGLTPLEATIMVAIPEIDGAAQPTVFGGRFGAADGVCTGCDRACHGGDAGHRRDMQACAERVAALAARVAKLVALKRSERAERRIAVTLFNFPPNAGAVGTAAFLSVFESLHLLLRRMRAEGYTVGELPESAEALRDAVVIGNGPLHGMDANVHTRIAVDDHVRGEPWLRDIEAQWGAAPGRAQSDGRSLFILGRRFGNVFVGVQPAFGYEGDPMRLLFEGNFAPTHAFAAYYRWLRESFGAHAVLHFGTHGALEFMPGKQAGLAEGCWPERLIGDLPNFNIYAANNPSEGALAKRRGAATLISHLTPPIAQAGLYRGLADLKSAIDRFRAAPPEAEIERARLAEMIREQAAALDFATPEPAAAAADRQGAWIARLADAVLELEYTLIPHGLHVVGRPPSAAARVDLLLATAEASFEARPERALIEALVAGAELKTIGLEPGLAERLRELDRRLATDAETPAILHALDGGFLRPGPAGDLIRSPDSLPTGRNLHGFDPFRIPSAFAMRDGARQAELLLERHVADGNAFPESIALVLWGADTLKTEGGPIGQALALLGARPRFDGYGRLAGAELVPLAELGRPRVDVVVTLSGIFRDLLPLQIKLLAEAALLAAGADEPAEQNFVRKHALAFQAKTGCALEQAALRVFSNAEGAYGSNVNQLVDSGAWEDEDELADAYEKRKCFAYGCSGRPERRPDLLQSVLAEVDLAYQNLESVELGVTTIDHYFDTLGGIGRAVRRARGGSEAPVYIGDQTRGDAKVRTLSEQVALETRTRTLNPKWYEGLLSHGYEGVRQIEAHVTNTMGWSATTGQVDPWVYQQITQTFVLDEEMRERMSALNPKATAKVASRLIEAHERKYWTPDPATLDALRRAEEALEDRLEGVAAVAAE